MSFAAEAASELAEYAIKVAQDYSDDTEDVDDSSREKRYKLLKALAALAVGGGAAYGGYKLLKHYTPELAAAGRELDRKAKPTETRDPNSVTQRVGDISEGALHGAGLGLAAGAGVGVVGAGKAGLRNTAGPVGRALASVVGVRDATQDAATRFKQVFKSDKEGNGSGSSEAKTPSLLSKALSFLSPAVHAPTSSDAHRAVASNIRSELERTGAKAKPADVEARIQRHLDGAAAATPSTNFLRVPSESNPAQLASAKSIPEAAEKALETSRSPLKGISPLENLRRVGQAAVGNMQAFQATSGPRAGVGQIGAQEAVANEVLGKPSKSTPSAAEQTARARFVGTLGEQLPALAQNVPRVRNKWLRQNVVEPLSHTRAPAMRGMWAGALAGGLDEYMAGPEGTNMMRRLLGYKLPQPVAPAEAAK